MPTRKLTTFFRNARRGGVSAVDVGFFSTARYPDGTYAAQVALTHEYGAKNIPSRPFFRQAIKNAAHGLTEIAKRNVDPERMIVDRRTADLMGAHMQGQVQSSIRTLRDPPNAPATIRRKGSSNPLIDTGKMRRSVSWRVYSGRPGQS